VSARMLWHNLLAWTRLWRPDPQRAILDGMSDEEFADILGPSWAAMTPDQRARYPGGWTVADWEAAEGRGRGAA
jgi:hypothetical protein